MSTLSQTDGLLCLRRPFPENQISLLPRPTKKDATKGKCDECGGWHGLPAVHLKYVGHAALTDRLLDADPFWSWEPMSVTADGQPFFDKTGGLWIKLMVCGVERLGYGNAENSQHKEIGSREKEIIGDALRNAAMRFGAALDLWHKGDLHVQADETPLSPPMQALKEQNAEQMTPKFSVPASVQARADAAPKVPPPLFPVVTKLTEDLGSYVIKFGKYKNTMLSDMDIYVLDGYLKWLKNSSAKDKKPMAPQTSELCEIGETYIKERLYRAETGQAPMPDDNDEIPF